MLNPEQLFNNLRELDISFYAGVPDSLLKNFCAYITDNLDKDSHIITANEGSAVGLGIGYHLATNKTPVIYMQNSGLGNTVNPITSLADPDVYSIPMLLVIGWRGEPGVKDEPQHVKQGKITLRQLETMGVDYKVISAETTEAELVEITKTAAETAKKNSCPFALVVKKGTFSAYSLQNNPAGNNEMLREEAIQILSQQLGDSDAIVSTTGVTSRELFEIRAGKNQGHQRDFLTVGGMGHTSQIALGIALQKKDRQVYCFDGDGSTLMHMGALPINASMKCKNFKHIIFNNGAHDSVGGQPTVALEIDLPAIAKASGYAEVRSVATRAELEEAGKWLANTPGPVLLEVRVNKGFRKDLGRPTTTPVENKNALMEFLSK